MSNDVKVLTYSRIRNWFEDQGYKHTSVDGRIVATWNGDWFNFQLAGSGQTVLRILAQWQHPVPAQLRPQLLEFSNTWNAGQLFPRASVATAPDGAFFANADFTVDYRLGVSDEQLADSLAIGVTTIGQYFARLAKQFPELVTQP